jgi:hypothetical protein
MGRGYSPGSDRPPSARSNIGNWSGRGNSYRTRSSFGTSATYFNANRGRSNLGNSRFAGGSLENASFSRFGSNQFAGSRFQGFERNSFGRNGLGRRGYGDFGRGGFGYHRGGWYGGGGHGGEWHRGGWNGGGNDLWFLGDLFGLALDFGSFVWNPWAPVGLLGLNLLDTGIQALDSLDNNDQQASYNPPLCGNYYSDENPGCLP